MALQCLSISFGRERTASNSQCRCHKCEFRHISISSRQRSLRCGQNLRGPFLSGVRIVLCPDHTSHKESGPVIWRWTKSNFLGPLPECGKDQWDRNIVNYYIAHTLLTSCNVRRCKIVLQFLPLSWWMHPSTVSLDAFNPPAYNCLCTVQLLYFYVCFD